MLLFFWKNNKSNTPKTYDNKNNTLNTNSLRDSQFEERMIFLFFARFWLLFRLFPYYFLAI